MNTGKKIAYNSFVSVASRALATVVSLIIVGLMTRYLGKSGYGSYSTILAFVYVFTVLADLGLYSIAVRDISREGADEEKIIKNAFSIRFLAGLFLFLMGVIIVWFFPYSSLVKKGVAIGSIGFWFLSNVNVLIGLFQKHLRMEKVALAELAGRAVQLGLVWWIIRAEGTFLNLVWAMSLAGLVNFVLVFYFARRWVGLKLELDFSFWRRMLKQSLPLAAASVLVMVYFKLDTIMLSLMKDETAVGIYSVAYRVLENLIFLPTMFVGLLMPLFSRYFAGDLSFFKKTANLAQRVFLITVVPLVGGGIFLAERIIIFLAGRDFFEAGPVLAVLLVALGAIFFGAIYSNLLIAAGQQKKLTWVFGLGALFNFSLNLIFIPRFSFLGAAFTTLLTEILVTTLMLLFCWRSFRFLPTFASAGPAFFATTLMLLILYFLREQNLLVLVGTGGVIYLLVLYFVGGIKRADFKFVFGKDVL